MMLSRTPQAISPSSHARQAPIAFLMSYGSTWLASMQRRSITSVIVEAFISRMVFAPLYFCFYFSLLKYFMQEAQKTEVSQPLKLKYPSSYYISIILSINMIPAICFVSGINKNRCEGVHAPCLSEVPDKVPLPVDSRRIS